MTVLKVGMRLKSAVCSAEIMVIKASPGEYALCCGGRELLDMGSDRDPAATPTPGFDGGCLVGKRYVDEKETIELLCTRAGQGALALSGKLLGTKQAKALPSSD